MPPLAGGKAGNTEEDGDDRYPNEKSSPIDDGMNDTYHRLRGLVF